MPEENKTRTRAAAVASHSESNARGVGALINEQVSHGNQRINHIRRQNSVGSLTGKFMKPLNNVFNRGGLTHDQAVEATQWAKQAKQELRANANSGFDDGETDREAMHGRPLSPSTIKRGESSLNGLENALGLGPNKRHAESQRLVNSIEARTLKRAEKKDPALKWYQPFDMTAYKTNVAERYMAWAGGSHHELSKYTSPMRYHARKWANKNRFGTAHYKEGDALREAAQELKGEASEAYGAEKIVDNVEKHTKRFKLGARPVGWVTAAINPAAGAGVSFFRHGVETLAWAANTAFARRAADKFGEHADNTEEESTFSENAFFRSKERVNRQRSWLFGKKTAKAAFSSVLDVSGTGIDLADHLSGVDATPYAEDALKAKRYRAMATGDDSGYKESGHSRWNPFFKWGTKKVVKDQVVAKGLGIDSAKDAVVSEQADALRNLRQIDRAGNHRSQRDAMYERPSDADEFNEMLPRNAMHERPSDAYDERTLAQSHLIKQKNEERQEHAVRPEHARNALHKRPTVRSEHAGASHRPTHSL